MTTKHIFVFVTAVVCGVAGFICGAPHALAITPSFSLTQTSGSSGQIFVYGDRSSVVRLFYGPSSSLSAEIGTTDQNGNLTLPISLTSYAVACGNRAYVSINGQESPVIAWALNPSSCPVNPSGNLSFSQDNVVLNVGQSQTVVLYGSAPFSVSSNSNSSVISASISGNVMTVSAVAFGGATIRVCGTDNQCANVSVVAVNNGPQQNNTNTQPFGLSSLTVASDNLNGKFINTGNTLTISFSANRPLATTLMKINGASVSLSGGGTGPYTASYKVTGNEAALFPVSLTFSDTSGTAGQATFALGALSSVSVPPVSSPVPAPAPAPTPTPAPAPTPTEKFTFTKFLNLDATGTEVSELQRRLTSLGFYSGPITGKFGPLTEAAVKKLQKAHGLAQAGYVGPGTRAILNK